MKIMKIIAIMKTFFYIEQAIIWLYIICFGVALLFANSHNDDFIIGFSIGCLWLIYSLVVRYFAGDERYTKFMAIIYGVSFIPWLCVIVPKWLYSSDTFDEEFFFLFPIIAAVIVGGFLAFALIKLVVVLIISFYNNYRVGTHYTANDFNKDLEEGAKRTHITFWHNINF